MAADFDRAGSEDGLTSFADLLGGMAARPDGALALHVPADWMQGRTFYGGLSAALCLAGVRRAHPDLPSLRTAMISFVGPAAGDARVRASVLRRGKSATFITADLENDGGESDGAIATRATFCFGAARASALSGNFLPAPDVPSPEAIQPFFPSGAGPAFTRHFDMLQAAGPRVMSGASEAEIFLWARARDASGTPADVALLAIADAPPPAGIAMMSVPAPISTMSWMVEVLTEDLGAPGDWLLLRSRADFVADGYQAQSMSVWSRDGRPLIAARQTVGIFG
jgi:acyl-coenzyme A thioesterase PaaI-like protein